MPWEQGGLETWARPSLKCPFSDEMGQMWDLASGGLAQPLFGHSVRGAPISDVPMMLRAHADSRLPLWISCWTLEVKQPTSWNWPQRLSWQPHSSLGRAPGPREWSQPLAPRRRCREEVTRHPWYRRPYQWFRCYEWDRVGINYSPISYPLFWPLLEASRMMTWNTAFQRPP